MANLERQRGNDIGPTGLTLGANLARARKAANLSLKELSAKLDELDRKISWSGISKIENGNRKVDADELIALALTLNVSPLALLLPQSRERQAPITLTGLDASAESVWKWALGSTPLSGSDRRGFQARSLPEWLFIDVKFGDRGPFGMFQIDVGEQEHFSDSDLNFEHYREARTDG